MTQAVVLRRIVHLTLPKVHRLAILLRLRVLVRQRVRNLLDHLLPEKQPKVFILF